jgi:hypothetical protein
MPISLSRGHIRTAEFKINVEASYVLYAHFDLAFAAGPGGRGCASFPRTSWELSKQGQVVARGDRSEPDEMGGVFSADAGMYRLDLEVWDDGSCLNAGSPQVGIAALDYQHSDVDHRLTRAFFASLLLAVTGLNLLLYSARARRPPGPECSLTLPGPLPQLSGAIHTAYPTPTRGYDLRNSRQPYVWAFQKPSSFGLIASTIFVLKPGIPAKPQPGIEPLLVRVESRGRNVTRSLYIGSQRIPPEDFGRVLRYGLTLRPPTWPVYVVGDSDLEWGDVMKAIDEIRGLHAEVVLLTPRTAPSGGQSR